MSAQPGPYRPQLNAAVAALGMQVDRETVLQARAALLAEADRLDDVLRQALLRYEPVGLCGGDPVSPEAAAGFNERIDALFDQCRGYNQDLREAALALDLTARTYGYTEDEIVASYQTDR